MSRAQRAPGPARCVDCHAYGPATSMVHVRGTWPPEWRHRRCPPRCGACGAPMAPGRRKQGSLGCPQCMRGKAASDE